LKKFLKNIKISKFSQNFTKKGVPGPYLGFFKKTPKNSVFLTFFDDFPLENQGRLTEETRVQKRPPKCTFSTFFTKNPKHTTQKINIYTTKNNINKKNYFTTQKLNFKKTSNFEKKHKIRPFPKISTFHTFRYFYATYIN
jgi:ERCC4-type nuclease